MKMKPTPGPWKTNPKIPLTILTERGALNLASCHTAMDFPYAELAANAALIAEAGTVHHETGLSPRELLEQRDDAIRHLKELLFCGPTKYAQAELAARAFFTAIAATKPESVKGGEG